MTTHSPASSIESNVLAKLRLIAGLTGRWHGYGMNIAARPDFQNHRDVLLSVSLTSDSLSFDPIPATVHNRGFTQPDIELFGFTYLQHTSEAGSGAPLHIEPGMWIALPPTTQPPAEPPPDGQLVARMWSIPHGASMVAQGFAQPFCGPPVISPGADPTAGANPAFSSFPSFNSTPLLPAFPDPTSAVFAAGTSEAPAKGDGGFAEYTFSDEPAAHGTDASADDAAQRLPAGITQQVFDDPILLLQQKVEEQIADGYQFDGVAVNISTAPAIPFRPQPTVFPDPDAPVSTVNAPQFGGGIANHTFLLGISDQKPNLSTSLVYATFWLETLRHADGRPPLRQLQYAQTALVNFPARNLPGQPNVSWPHVTVATLQPTGQR